MLCTTILDTGRNIQGKAGRFLERSRKRAQYQAAVQVVDISEPQYAVTQADISKFTGSRDTYLIRSNISFREESWMCPWLNGSSLIDILDYCEQF